MHIILYSEVSYKVQASHDADLIKPMWLPSNVSFDNVYPYILSA